MTHPDDPTQQPPSDDRPETQVPDWQRPKDESPAGAAPGPDAGPSTGSSDGSSGDDPFASTPPQPYSSYRPTYQQPAPGGNGWKVATIVLSVILSFVVLAFGGLMALGFFIAMNEITSPDLDDAVASSCEELSDAAGLLEPLAAPDEAPEVIAAMAEAARAIADDAEAGGTDSSADRRFVDAAGELADALEELAADPTEPFDVPTRDGTPVPVVMSQGTPTCLLPPVITGLDPDAGNDLVVTEGSAF